MRNEAHGGHGDGAARRGRRGESTGEQRAPTSTAPTSADGPLALSSPQPAPLARRLGTADATLIGLGSMLGAGIFAAVGPAAAAAGPALLAGLVLAGAVAYVNATSTAQLAAHHPVAGGAYVYGRLRLGETWGFLAGWGFVTGKTASCAAMALTFGAYLDASLMRPLAIAAVIALTAVNLLGIERTAAATRVLVVLVLAALAVAVAGCLGGGEVSTGHLSPFFAHGARGVLESAGLLFFAFAGYARIATLGEEVREPATTIPRAVRLALAIAFAVYALVTLSALLAGGPGLLAHSGAPLAAAVDAGSLHALTPVVRAGAVVASLGVLLSMVAGVSRTALAMAREGDLPRALAAVHPVRRVPHVAELAVAAIVIAVVALADVRGAIGFSAFTVLVYYAVANAAAARLAPHERRFPRAQPLAGVAACALLAATLPFASVAAGAGVLLAGLLAHALRARL